MSLKERILDDLKAAMKAKETDKTMVLRSLKAKILEKEISERKGGESSLNDEQIIEVLMKAAKQRKESIEQFQEGGREELAEKEANELKIIERYLPAMMSEEEIREAAQKEIERLEISSMAEMGKVMGALMGKLKGKAEGSVISKVVKEELSKK
ncbi:MAG: GatB/YqeY domain-containing protein [Balneolaceae bacterium]|nr:GatB/YqeY domain-containing protein [Balneolaceae bacterium]